jgi:hypothetical protein
MTTVAHVVLVSNPESADPTSKFGSSHQLDSHFNCQHKLQNGILGSPRCQARCSGNPDTGTGGTKETSQIRGFVGVASLMG